MCKKTLFLVVVVALGLAGSTASGDITSGLVGYWPLDGDAADASGNGLDGEVLGNVVPAEDRFAMTDTALFFPGAGNSYVELGDPPELRISGAMTLAAWVRIDSYETNGRIISRIGPNGQRSFSLNIEGEQYGHVAAFQVAAGGSDLKIVTTADRIDFGPDDWVHIAGTFEPGAAMKIYINGALDNALTTGVPNSQFIANTVRIGKSGTSWGQFPGSIDDVRVYDRALSEGDIWELYLGEVRATAFGPSPPDESMLNQTWVSLTWKSGAFAASHGVYMGTDFDDVDRGAEGTFIGNTTDELMLVGIPDYPIPEGLQAGETYYWRVDEVNDTDPNSPWKGDIWSFSIPSNKAHESAPADDAKYVATDVTLTWTPGHGAALHRVYFGDNLADVENGTPETYKGQFPTAEYVPGTLDAGKTYYWRVDELDEASATHTGDVWSFKTIPEIAVTDSSLLGWWKLDEGQGTMALDWSGHGNHGTLTGEPQWAEGYDGGALEFEYTNINDGVAVKAFDVVGGGITLAAWVKPESFSQNDGRIVTKASGTNTNDHWWMLSTIANGPDYTLRFRLKTDDGQDTATLIADEGALVAGEWAHVAGTWDGTSMIIYKDGLEVARAAKGGAAVATSPSLGIAIGNHLSGTVGNRAWDGLIDDVRVYDKALSAEELKQAMRGDPLAAWAPSPGNNTTVGIDEATSLSWQAGDEASQHDVYFGTDKDAVTDADTSTTGIYRGRQGVTGYTPPEGIEWGGGPYYWRIDEYNTDGTTSTGRVWSFTVANFIPVDDFEDYGGDEVPVQQQIWYAWRDGLGYGTVDTPPYYPGNGTGSEVGDIATASYTEETIVNGGSHSMPYWYNNNKPDKSKYSEAAKTLPAGLRDWTDDGVKALSLWFQGRPASTGSFTVAPNTYTMTASGEDIWYASDEFHYAYKQLTSVGTIQVQVLSVDNTNPWAKAGVMIRDTLDADSKFAAVYITPGNGCRFQARLDTAIDATSDTSVVTAEQTAITAPYWVRLERDVAGNFTGYYSSNGTTWQPISWNPQNVQMNSTAYIGLAVTAHNQGNPVPLTCEAVFSGVTMTGNVTGQWAHQDIGIISNAAEPMYVAIANNTGPPAVVYHDDPAATTIDTWTEWPIDLKDFADKGIDLTDVNSIAIGFGDRNNPQPGGAGKMYFDDIRLYRPRYIPGKGTPLAADFNGDGVVDFGDLEMMAGDWLAGNAGLAADLNTDGTVDFKDYAVLAEAWLDEQLWPEW